MDFENRALWRVFGPKRLNYRDHVKKDEMGGACGTNGGNYWWEGQKDLRERMGRYALDRSSSGQGPVEGSCEHGNEPSGSIKCCEVLV
jgi:hypothetical protein